MTRKMLINATHPNEARVALIDNQWLYDLEIENINKEQKKGNIYKAIVTKVEYSLDAVFVNYGGKKNGFLPFKEIFKEHLNKKHIPDNESVKNFVTKNTELIVQITKEERKNKGASLTTYISLAGCYLVLMPNNSKIEGISRHINGDDRQEIRKKLNTIKIPEGMGVIIRTAGLGKKIEELQWEIDVLSSQFKAIKKLATKKKSPHLLYQESNLITRAIRDNLHSNIQEIVIDELNVFKTVREYLSLIKFNFINKVKLYNDIIPLFSKYKIEHQIELAFKRKLFLPSGGVIVIDNTEALISIDINSAKAKKGADIGETALQTNLEAVNEIARQLRIRDLGGLIVIDFIDMNNTNNQRVVEKDLKNALLMDKAKTQVGKISRFGLLEMSRQRLRHSLIESNEHLCPQCNGVGKLHNVKILSSIVLRAIEEESIDLNTSQINIELPLELVTYIINMKKNTVSEIEKKQKIKIMIITNKYLSMSEYRLYKIKTNNKTVHNKPKEINKNNKTLVKNKAK